MQTVPLPEEIRRKILANPLYRQPEAQKIIPASNSCFEQGRCGKGPLAGLKFKKLGSIVVYAAADIIEFLESMPSFINTTQADAYKSDLDRITRRVRRRVSTSNFWPAA